MKPTIEIVDVNFSAYVRTYQEPSADWSFNSGVKDAPVTVYVDRMLPYAREYTSKIKIAWICEPPVIDTLPYDFAMNYSSWYDEIYTHMKNLCKRGPKYKWYPHGVTHIVEKHRSIHPKTKKISIVASNKNSAPGHVLRHEIIYAYRDKVDLYGGAYNPIINKFEGIKDYQYNIAIENSIVDGYWTEKIIDCFLTGTVPIYWGATDIGEYFDKNGIIIFDKCTDLKDILNDIGEADYKKREKAIRTNFEEAKKYISIFENVWHAGIKKHYGL